ncbi:hypothetical protein [Chondromyces apiculatus]|uniref:Uncharacterized protein n=1 Tax=Chondromyces apiculatus DSM 436 TaxID=1192034 RepID=A0A017TEV4_9BACT|nr:hypothetical protein [Chondromyces apiculatus]EYF07828.1 Hypothetical protein CAP_6850 [Chondromyces apiculatus DSM 436]
MTTLPASVDTQQASCKLEASLVEVRSDHLTLRYRFSNESSRTALLFNRLFSTIDATLVFQTSKNTVYVEVDETSAILSKKLVPVPPDIDVERPVVPLVTAVKPGEGFEETLSIPLPLRPHQPYPTFGRERPQEVVSPRDSWFELGLLLVPPEGLRLAKEVQTTEGVALSIGPVDARDQVVLRAGPLAVKLPAHAPQ